LMAAVDTIERKNSDRALPTGTVKIEVCADDLHVAWLFSD